MSSSTTNIINPNTPGLDPMIASGQRTTTRASSFAASLPAGAVIGQLVDPFGGGAVYSTVGTVPPQLALSGSAIVKGSAAAVEGAEYRIRILATSSDGLRDVSTILSFTARVLSGSPAPVALSISGTPSAAMVGSADTFTPTIAGGTLPYSLSVASGALPGGRSIAGLAVTGSYTAAGSFSYTLRATDSKGATADLPITITVAASAAVLRAVGTGGRAATGTRTFGTTTKWRNRSTTFVRSATTFVEFRYPNWYVDDAGVTQAVSYPAGTTMKCQFDMYTNGTVANAAGDKTGPGTLNGAAGNVGATIVGGAGEPWIIARINASDLGLATIPAGAAICCLLEGDTTATGVAFPLTDSAASTATGGENFIQGGTTSIGTYGPIANNGGTGQNYGLRPIAVLGDGTREAIIAIGDSNTAGKGLRPASDGSTANGGMAAKGLWDTGRAFTAFGKNGDRASFWDAAPSSDPRWIVVSWFDGAAINLGTNDLSPTSSNTSTTASTAATVAMRSLRPKVKAALQGQKKIAQAYILPRVSNDTGFTTLAEQNIKTGYANAHAARPAYDADMVADVGVAGRALDAVFNPRIRVSDQTETDRWAVDGTTPFLMQIDGIHLSLAGATAASPAYTNVINGLFPA